MTSLKRISKTLGAIFIIGLALPCINHASLIAGGDVIKLDLGDAGDGDGGSLADWNQQVINGTLGAGSIIRHGDGATIDDVTITLAGRNGDVNDPAGSGWGGIGTDPYFIGAVDDILFSSDGSALTVTFDSLDNALSYNVRVYSLLTGESFTAPLDVSVTDGGGIISRTGLNRNSLHATVPLSSDLIFNDVSTNGSGTLQISAISTQPFSLQAIALEANTVIPEPSSLALAAIGGLIFMIRRRRFKH